MANYIIIPFLFYFSISAALDIDYYWKDYYGVMPEDAFVAVKNADDTTVTYIGQAFTKQAGVFPTPLYSNATSVITFSGETNNSVVSSNLKVLATQRTYSLKWVKIHYNDIASFKKIDFMKIVEGGFETDAVLYIGRSVHEGGMQIGKINTVAPNEGLILANKEDGGTTVLKEFELLVYASACW